MAKPALSVVAVVINNLEVSKRFVSSIRQYTKSRYELILVDNASTDPKASEFYRKSADKYFFFQERVSLAKAWNKGLELSTGKYVAVANNDTVVPENWFENLKQVLDRDKNAGMVSPLTLWLIKQHYQNRLVDRLHNNFTKPYKLKRFKEVVWGEFLLYKKSVLDKIGGFCELYEGASGEDLEILFQVYDHNFNVYLDPRVFVYHEGRRSQTPDIISKKDRNNAWDKNWKLFLSRWPKYTQGWK